METRMERYKEYRDWIAFDNIISVKKNNDETVVDKYKKRIDNINPKILSDFNKSSLFSTLISINDNDNYELNKIRELFKSINLSKIESIDEKINELTMILEQKNIIDNNGNVNQEWIKHDEHYQIFNQNKDTFKEIKNKIAQLQVKVNDGGSTNENFSSIPADKIVPTQISTTPKNKLYKKSYFFSIILICISILIMTILFLIDIEL